MITVTIAEVAIKRGTNVKGDWINTRIKDTNGKWYGTFNKVAEELKNKKGCDISFEPIPDGEFTKFETWVISEPEHLPDARPDTTQRPEISPQERGMWWKELGNRIGDGSLDKDFPSVATRIKNQYYKEMEGVTGISLKKEETN